MIVHEELRIELPAGNSVSGLLDTPEHPHATFVFAHGAGAGMTHRFMQAFTEALCSRGIAVLRYQFPFIEKGQKRPDVPVVAQQTVRAAVACAATRLPGIPLFAGGKSFGGRMTSQAQSSAALPGVEGLVFVGFPLHPAKKPAIERADHLFAVDSPMLFLQGTRDDLAELDLITALVSRLGARATALVIDDADHAFHVRVSSGTNDDAVLYRMADATASWMRSIA